MNIEQLIPKGTIDRDDFIKYIILPDEGISFIGADFTDIIFKFKTNIPLEHEREIIKHKDVELITFNRGNSWSIVSNDIAVFLPKEYLLEEWQVI